MHIKRITIEGFRSYKEQTTMEDFDSGFNVIVGRNGSGKSNFFAAIRFLLMEHGQILRQVDRKHELHDGAGRSALSAYVEIVFDNSDGRLPSDKEEVSLRRTIGMKKDEYFIDRHHMNKSEVASFLESAGFSRSNPYYIVQQGKVNELAVKKDNELLALLKDVAGTKVYEERRKESLDIMESTKAEREKILEVISHMDERLNELEEEKAELMEYHKLDKEKRSLEYTIYEKQLQEVRTKLEKIEADRRDDSDSAEALHARLAELKEQFVQIDSDHGKVLSEIESLEKEKDVINEERKDALKARANLEIEAKEADEHLRITKQKFSTSADGMKGLMKEIENKEKQLATKILPAYKEAVQKEKDLKDDLAAKKRRLAELHDKQGRGQQFDSVDERDAWLKEEIETLQKLLKEKQKQIKDGERHMRQLGESIAEKENELKDTEQAMDDRKKALASCQEEKARLTERRNELSDQRKDFWKKRDDMEKKITECSNEKKKAESTLKSSTAASIGKGLAAVERLVEENNIRGVHGPLIELLKADAKFDQAIEVTAGNSLFHVVVDDDNVAERLMKLLQQKNEGRVTFMPLNRLRQFQSKEEKKMPELGKDAFPMISRLDYPNQFEPAFRQVFGKTLVCRSLDVATRFSRQYDMNCVTLQGDQVNKKGAMTGGFIDTVKSRLAAMRVKTAASKELDSLKEELEKTKTVLNDLEQEMSIVFSDLQKIDHKVGSNRDADKAVLKDAQRMKDAIAQYQKTLKDREASVEEARRVLAETQLKIDSLQTEMGTELLSTLAPAEKEEVMSLNKAISKLEKQEVEISDVRYKMEEKKEAAESELNNNLKRRLDELKMETATGSVEEQESKKAELTTELDRLNNNISELNRTRDEIDRKLKDLVEQRSSMEKKMEESRNLEAEIENDIAEEGKRIDRLVTKRSIESNKKEELLKKIRELGSLPQGAYDEYKNVEVKKLIQMLHSTSNKLKKYDHVNKKAMDQFVTFTEQRQELTGRKEEMDKGEQSIKDLIEHLDRKKEEAIERTFKQVSQNFEEIFAELVHGGNGKLTIKTGMSKRKRADYEQDDDDDDDDAMDEENAGGVMSYQGVSVEVTFPGGTTAQNISALSGGQKTMVALCLIFAIQRCDPAPFYLFDEIDANLDDAHRAAVANMIQKASSEAQYIVSTFRPEMIGKGNKFYEVSYQNRVSKISPIDKKKSLQFVEKPSEG